MQYAAFEDAQGLYLVMAYAPQVRCVCSAWPPYRGRRSMPMLLVLSCLRNARGTKPTGAVRIGEPCRATC